MADFDSARLTDLQEIGQEVAAFFPVGRRNEDIDGLPDGFLSRMAEHALGCRIEAFDRPIVANGNDCVGGRLYDGGQSLFVFAQRGFRELAFDDFGGQLFVGGGKLRCVRPRVVLIPG